MNKLFLEKLQKKIDYLGKQLELFEKDDEIIEFIAMETYYSSLKWARDLYLNCIEDEEKSED